MAAPHSKEDLRQTVESRLPEKSTYGGEIVPNCEPRPPESEWVISIKEKLDQGRQDNMQVSGAELSIYRFPSYLKYGDEKDWVPQIVSLGPYHHGREGLRPMERHKWRCLHRILERSGQEIGLYLNSVKEVEGRARTCYEETISMSSNEFVEMMVLDGCFVIELFQGIHKGFEVLGYPDNDPIFSMRPSMFKIQQDMIMLENQIPLIILDRLLSLQLGDPNQKGGVAKLAILFFKPLMRHYTLEFNSLHDLGGVHILEVHWRRLPILGPKPPETELWSRSRGRLTPCLTELRLAGVKIRSGFERRFGDIEFKDGVLRIPPLEIHEGTRSLFLNLIALEQCHLDCSDYVTSYVIFMRELISSPEDVTYLRDHEIIKHYLGSDADVADLFERLCREVAFDMQRSYLFSLSIKVHEYCRSKFWDLLFPWRANLKQNWNSWRAILNSKYFDNPWSIISVVAASVLLVLSFAQTFYAIYGYYRPRS